MFAFSAVVLVTLSYLIKFSVSAYWTNKTILPSQFKESFPTLLLENAS
jgi:hypothetical protein